MSGEGQWLNVFSNHTGMFQQFFSVNFPYCFVAASL